MDNGIPEDRSRVVYKTSWRDTSPHDYLANGYEYIDYSDSTDFPDMISGLGALPVNIAALKNSAEIGFGASASVSLDRFGNVYVTVGAAFGFGGGMAQSETYFTADTYETLRLGIRRLPTEYEIRDMSLCTGVSASLYIGTGAGLCGYFSFGEFRIGGYRTYSKGPQIGVSYDFASYTGNVTEIVGKYPEYEWDSIMNYRAQGITRAEVERRAMLQYGSCP